MCLFLAAHTRLMTVHSSSSVLLSSTPALMEPRPEAELSLRGPLRDLRELGAATASPAPSFIARGASAARRGAAAARRAAAARGARPRVLPTPK